MLHFSTTATTSQPDATEDTDKPPRSKIAKLDPFANLRDGCSTKEGITNDVAPSGREELAQYKALRVPAKYCSPLTFWQENAKEYPLMSEVARRVLCISASSAQSERDFSSVGRTITDARSRLSPGKVEAMEIVRWGCRASI